MYTASRNWRGGREAEGAPLLREYGVKNFIEGSNPSLSAINNFVTVRGFHFDESQIHKNELMLAEFICNKRTF